MASVEQGSFQVFPEFLKKLWDLWNLRAIISISLSVQVILILFSPMRRRITRSWTMIMPLWSAYFLAVWVSNLAVGLISGKQSGHNADLLAFWAPFFLVHLGAPDNITAFSLADNQLWFRHLLSLIFQCLVSIFIFYQTLQNNKLWIPTTLMLFNGVIKCYERTRSLYLASFERFGESVLITRIKEAAEPIESELSDFEVLQCAYNFFETFKGLLVNQMFSFLEHNQSQVFFLKRTAKDAFRVVEVELSFIYDVLYTKIPLVHCKVGYLSRSFSLCSVVIALVLFNSLDKNEFVFIDVGLTYTLLISALSLDIIALIMLVFSDWTVVAQNKLAAHGKLLNLKRRKRWFEWRSCLELILMPTLARRWSESVATYNLLQYCLHPHSRIGEKIYGFLGIRSFIDEVIYVKHTHFTKDLRNFIFEELKTKSELADDLETVQDICSSRGDWVLLRQGYRTLLPYIVDVAYDESLLLWHIATEFCYNNIGLNIEEGDNVDVNQHRDFSKLLSDYMLYLLVMQPQMMSVVTGIANVRFQDTCTSAKKILGDEITKLQGEQENGFCFNVKKFFFRGKLCQYKAQTEQKQKQACEIILQNMDTFEGDTSSSLWFDGHTLATELQKMGEKERWDITSRVWVELLSYAASNCKANSHAQQLSEGGELISVVWLLIVHLGIGDQFQIANLASVMNAQKRKESDCKEMINIVCFKHYVAFILCCMF